MGAAIPLIAAAAPMVIKGIEGIFAGDPNKNAERQQAISQLQTRAAQGDSTAVAQLQEWATGTSVGGDSSRSNEPNNSRGAAASALSSLGIPVQGGAPGSGAGGSSGTSGSILPAVAGGAAGALGGLAGGGVNGALAGAGIGQAAQDYANQQGLYDKALAQEQQQYAQTAPLRSQGVAAVQSAVGSGGPDLSAAYATPSNPFARSAPPTGTPVPGVTPTAPLPVGAH